MAFVQELLNRESVPGSERLKALNRVYRGPGLPNDDRSTASFWLRQEHPDIRAIQSACLPESADVVIIGSGITGTSVARKLLASQDASGSAMRVVMLEARALCSGATGRNGGHCLETVEDYLGLKQRWGREAAQKITKFKLSHLDALMAIAEEYGIVQEAQVRKVQFLSAYFDDEAWRGASASIKAFKNDMPEESSEWELLSGPAEMQKRSLPRAKGIVSGPAGALWPYKFVTSILAALSQNYRGRFWIETNTPVLSVKKTGESSYDVCTRRGLIRSKHVVHCTNGYAAHLLPSLLGSIYPLRGQMSAQKPLRDLPNYGSDHSWLFNYSAGFDYLTQLPVVNGVSDGEMMLGGGFVNSICGGVREIGVSRDDDLDADAGEHLKATLRNVFDTRDGHVNGIKSMWTGIMGFSADGLPWVGDVPEMSMSSNRGDSPQPGRQWIAAAFSGEGMVNTWLSGEALGAMILGSNQGRLEDVKRELCGWFPQEMMITEERIKTAKLTAELSPSHERPATVNLAQQVQLSSAVEL